MLWSTSPRYMLILPLLMVVVADYNGCLSASGRSVIAVFLVLVLVFFYHYFVNFNLNGAYSLLTWGCMVERSLLTTWSWKTLLYVGQR
jgi:hypothetical protein